MLETFEVQFPDRVGCIFTLERYEFTAKLHLMPLTVKIIMLVLLSGAIIMAPMVSILVVGYLPCTIELAKGCIRATNHKCSKTLM